MKRRRATFAALPFRAPSIEQSARLLATLMLLAMALSLSLSGCSGRAADLFSAGGVYPAHVNSVAVEMFRNATFERGIERRLTDAVIKEVRTRTPYRLAAPGAADSVLRGTITDVERVRISRELYSGMLAELGIRITINFEWVDERTGEVLTARRSFSSADVVVTASAVGEPLESGIDQVVQELAQGIVDAMRGDW